MRATLRKKNHLRREPCQEYDLETQRALCESPFHVLPLKRGWDTDSFDHLVRELNGKLDVAVHKGKASTMKHSTTRFTFCNTK